MEYNNLRFGRFDSINGWGSVYATEKDLNFIDGKGYLFARKINPNSHLYEILVSRQKNSGRVKCDEVASMQFF